MKKFIRMVMLYSKMKPCSGRQLSISLQRTKILYQYDETWTKLRQHVTNYLKQTIALFGGKETLMHYAYSNMACCDQVYETNGDIKWVSSCAKFEHVPCSTEYKVKKVCNDMRVSKCWLNLGFCWPNIKSPSNQCLIYLYLKQLLVT